MATRVTRLPGKIIATSTSATPLGLTDPGLYPDGGVALITILSGTFFFSVNNDGTIDKNYAASATVGNVAPMSFGSRGDLVYQANAIGDSFEIFV